MKTKDNEERSKLNCAHLFDFRLKLFDFCYTFVLDFAYFLQDIDALFCFILFIFKKKMFRKAHDLFELSISNLERSYFLLQPLPNKYLPISKK